MSNNAIHVIKPFKWNGMWVFDDDRVGLDKEPFVAGADVMIDVAIERKGIQDADDGFLLIFSEHPFPSADGVVSWTRSEGGGNVYQWQVDADGQGGVMEGWLCPALNLYYPDAPENLYFELRQVE